MPEEILVTVEVRGGVVEEVRASHPAKVYVRDWDNVKEEGEENYEDDWSVHGTPEDEERLVTSCQVCGWPMASSEYLYCEVCRTEAATAARTEANDHFNHQAARLMTALEEAVAKNKRLRQDRDRLI